MQNNQDQIYPPDLTQWMFFFNIDSNRLSCCELHTGLVREIPLKVLVLVIKKVTKTKKIVKYTEQTKAKIFFTQPDSLKKFLHKKLSNPSSKMMVHP